MGNIKKLVFPLIKKNIRLIISLILILVMGIGIVVGLTSSYKALKEDIFSYCEEYNYQDVTINTELALKKEIDTEEIKSLKGVEDVYLRLTLDFSLTHNDDILSCRMFTYSDTSFMKMRTIDYKETEDAYKVSVDIKFAENNNINVGDKAEINIYGYIKEVTVERIIALPEDISEKQNEYTWNGSSDFGFIYLNESVLEDAGLNSYFNQILLLNDGSVSNEELAADVRNSIEVSVLSTKTFEEAEIVNNMHYNIDPLKALSYFVPVIFFAVSVIVSVLFIYQIVSRYKKELGILLTLGYSKKSLYVLFGSIGGFVSLIGIAGGFIVGYVLDTLSYILYLDHFKIVFSFPSVDVIIFVIISLIAAVLSVGSSVFSTFMIVNKMTPLEAIASSSADTSSKGLKLKGKNPNLKIEINRVIRNYKANIISVLCISAVLSLMIAGFSFRNSKNVILDDFFNKRNNYDVVVYLDSQNISRITSDFKSVQGTSEVEVSFYQEMEIENSSGKKKNALFNAVLPSYNMVHILGTHHNIISMPEEGMVMEKLTADALGVKKGDYVKVNGYSIQVSAISTQDVFKIQYITIPTMEEISSSYKSCAFVNTSDKQTFKKEASALSYYQSLTDMEAMRKDAVQTQKISDVGIVIIVITSVVLGFAVVSNIKEIELFKEIKSVVVKRTIGFSLKSISWSLLIQDIIKTGIALIIGLPLGAFFSVIALKAMETDCATFPYVFAHWVNLISVAFMALFMLLTHVVLVRRISKIPLSEYIKDKE